jgi:hypothetical protein
MGRTGAVVAPPEDPAIIAPGYFRAVRRPVYDGLAAFGGGILVPLLHSLGLDPSGPGDVPIPTSGRAKALVARIDLDRERTTAVTTTRVTYGIVVPRPFCATGPSDFVKLEGPLNFTMSVSTSPWGRYDRTYVLGGTLRVTPMTPIAPGTFVPSGPTVDAPVFEIHRGVLTDEHAQVTENVEQSLHGDAFQSLAWSFAAGDTDRFVRNVVCGTE